MIKWITVFFTVFIFPLSMSAQNDTTSAEGWSVHFQQTIVAQYHPDFSAKYSGTNSLQTSEPAQTSITSTFFVGRKLWEYAELYLSPELAGGNGLSGVNGIAGFPNGETFRIGDPTPRVTLARAFIKQNISLSDENVTVEDKQDQIAGTISSSRISLSFGRISIADFFDKNTYSNDPRSQFLNWSLMNSAAWDYPADTRGYTWGFVLEYVRTDWAGRISSAMVPTTANGSMMDENIHEANSETAEIEHSYRLGEHPGTVRLLGYYTEARMGNYLLALQLAPGTIDIKRTEMYGRTKKGFALNVEQQIADDIGGFLRVSWNDGINETWMFTEIDQSVAAGVLFDCNWWKRHDDNFGLAVVVNNISDDHRRYLQAGGYGFLIGDGNLNYASEIVTELFYACSIWKEIWVTPDFQFVENPAYNRERGPVAIFGCRAHVEF